MLEVSFPHPGNVHEPNAFVVWGGCGAVLLHERDDERIAMLLERAQPATLAEVEDGDEAVTVGAAQPPPGHPHTARPAPAA
ncbi:Aminoglycoside/hydroxyurea antibiotic resistance kinase [Streptomyces cyanogenus]|uniref:Aminoglycoside/hydroxyurea antibiotic resistance kinase n=1 Tax=Streptomyces cyanogenus TaxID=80860 RepID=A0ABX7TJU8_STRCY|nr:Aminoglycoside/hydroxyurea antibiotic resistance kinase [Streptomyces cyanogenus]